MEQVPNTRFTLYAKVLTLIIMNMEYEKIAFDKNLKNHPFILTKQIIKNAINIFNALMDISFIEGDNKNLERFKSQQKEQKHHELWDEIWDKYNGNEFQQFINRKICRIKINNLTKLIKGKKCIDLGCGNGAFSFALLHCGAGFVAGIDFGEKSISYSMRYADEKGLKEKTVFKHASVYETGFKNDTFDFAVQNGVFHHLDDYEKAIREVKRVLKKGGWFFYYTDGEGGISYDLWDTSVYILREVPLQFIENVLNFLNVSRNKFTHLSDALNATYAHTSWDKICTVLSNHGFNNFKRLKGGFDTDFDLDRIETDPFGREKFGEGDLRFICQLIDK